jgi:ABC-type cobalamin/Fe3+-siderophores transport system ATPase subunit
VADRVVVMSGGRTVASGPAESVLDSERLAEVWDVDASVEAGSQGQTALRVSWLGDQRTTGGSS